MLSQITSSACSVLLFSIYLHRVSKKLCQLIFCSLSVKYEPISITRSSATAERQRVGYARLSRLTHWSCTSLWAPHLFYNYNRLAKLISTLPANKPCDIRTLNRAFKVIQDHRYWCRQESRMVCCRNVQLMPTLFLKHTKIWQRENGKFVDFNDHTQVWRRPSKKRLRISTNDLYCQKLELLTYIFVADSMCLHSLAFT